jgi:hypothetical protein
MTTETDQTPTAGDKLREHFASTAVITPGVDSDT